MKLNDAQKQWLFKNGYVTAKVLDAYVENGWTKYFIDNFEWELKGSDVYGFEQLIIKEKKRKKPIEYDVGLNFQGQDRQRLEEVK